jgi:hypothetical protein
LKIYRSTWPTSRIVIAVAWASDLIWLPMIGFGNAGAGVFGFGLSCVALLIAKASYDRHKAAGR